MTVKKLKEILEKCPDNYRIVLDAGGPNERLGVNHDNEVISAFSFERPNVPIVMLQIRNDTDVVEEITGAIEHFKSLNWTDEEIAEELVALGYDFDDYAFKGNLRDAMMKELSKEETKC